LSEQETDPYLDAMLQGREEAAPAEPVDEAPAEAEPVEAPPAEAEKPDTDRNPDGTFKPKVEDPEPAETPELILGKFKSPDDLAKSYTELEKHLGELRGDLASLKQQQEAAAIQAQQEQQDLAAQRQPGPVTDTRAVIDQLTENPVAIYPTALQAWQQGNQPLLDAALEAWQEYDAPGARRFERELLKAEMAQEYQKWTQPIQQRQEQTEQQSQVANVGAAAFTAVAARHPDLHELQNDIFEIASEAPEIAVAIASGDQKAAERAYENLRALILGRRADQLKVEQDKITAEQAAANDAARKDAVVASASSAKALGGEGAKKTAGDILKDVYTKPDESHLPYWERSDYTAA